MDAEAANLDSLSDLRTPWCIHVAATLRIAERVDAGIHDIVALAAAAKADADALHTVLSHLVSRGVFEETAPGCFALNDAARGLLDPARRIGLDLDGIGGRFARAWSTLLSAVRSGKPAYREEFGLHFWEDLEAHPDLAASFDALMGPEGHGIPDAEIPLADGWDNVRSVVDVGGGTGALLAQILLAHPGVRGTLVDLPRTAARAEQTFAAAGVAGRAHWIGQSFFDALPAGADLYILKSVLNDWPDAEAAVILRRCAEAARPGGRVVIMGGVSADDAPRRLGIDMVVAGGFRHRTLARFREMALEAGLDIVAAGRQASGRFVVECRPR